MTVPKCIIDMMETRLNNLTQIVKKLKNNEARPKFTGSYIKKSVYCSERISVFREPFYFVVSV